MNNGNLNCRSYIAIFEPFSVLGMKLHLTMNFWEWGEKIDSTPRSTLCNILTWPARLNTADVVDWYIDKIGVITGMSPCYAGVLVSVDVVDSFINKVIIGISPWPMNVVKLGDLWQIRPPIEVGFGK